MFWSRKGLGGKLTAPRAVITFKTVGSVSHHVAVVKIIITLEPTSPTIAGRGWYDPMNVLDLDELASR